MQGHTGLRVGRSSEEAEELRGDHLGIVQGDKMSRIHSDDFRLRNQGRGALREPLRDGFVA
jgi:hypothetical protein